MPLAKRIDTSAPAPLAPALSPDASYMEKRIAALEAENARLKAMKASGPLKYKVSEKGAVSVYGLTSKWPTTLYGNQWRRLLAEDSVKALLAFIDQSEAAGLLSKKDSE